MVESCTSQAWYAVFEPILGSFTNWTRHSHSSEFVVQLGAKLQLCWEGSILFI